MAIDYGTKRCGIAVTDPLHISITGLETLPPEKLMPFLQAYFQEEEVTTVVLGMPHHADGSPAQIAPVIEKFKKQLIKQFPDKEVIFQDESFSSVDAKEIILQSGKGKKKRRDKSLVDRVSATLILKAYLEAHVW